MADGFIVRRGGKVSEQALAPTITEVSVTDSSITFTIKNEDTEKAIIRYRIDDIDAEGEIIELAGGATSSNITASGLDAETEYIVFATANVTGKVKSNVTQLAIETDEPIIYTAATGGTTEEYNLDGKRYKSHTFTSNGTFEVTTAGNGDRNQVDYLIIAGGGGGGSGVDNANNGGGGGAGGYITTFGTQGGLGTLDSKPTVTETSYSVTIGLGGSANSNGTNSSVTFTGTPTATGGGRGGGLSSNNGGNGGSGGGGGAASGTQTKGTGTTNQGFDGGTGAFTTPFAGGAGGGAGEVGEDGGTVAKGGDGLSSVIRTGSAETRAGGGGSASNSGGTGGAGGGGNGAFGSTAATAGTVNTGSGGGGGSATVATVTAAAGGDGIVIIRYEIAPTV